jgi:hypothetical protein
MDVVTAGAAIIGLVNGFRLLKEATATRNFWGFAFFVLAVVSGTLFGALGWFALGSVEAGFTAGLVSSGAYRALELTGGIKV